MPTVDTLSIRPTVETDRDWMRAEMRKWWKSEVVVVRGEKHYPAEMDGFLAEKGNKRIGLVTLHIDSQSAEIMSLFTTGEVPGLGEKLVGAAIADLQAKNVHVISVVTTNDNIGALRFYQQLGFVVTDWRRNALEISRRIKPEIPLMGNYNIPIRDEIELEKAI